MVLMGDRSKILPRGPHVPSEADLVAVAGEPAGSVENIEVGRTSVLGLKRTRGPDTGMGGGLAGYLRWRGAMLVESRNC